ncbi:uncharacterized protein PODANS_6_6500 [Podospora anserina S mat+]|uniref:Podospora anserina S mat+ genomic DNA chromosome 6, supercontig 2 n=1 Tax=Podospora anserina (strain S / ATCC MYA-4624 / DSM 980 / FGSC 10383) TaxID=515849 RepID=B2B3K6_PODAN|nr:uncharacterized protein PODANS_6_6500 [Podospora anserina S mat+]CAP71692.1 unnamed protein product [Podospora anserina S mat+]CDP31083.1 Putative protein of unknown function [Podospora anserina S mat+]
MIANKATSDLSYEQTVRPKDRKNKRRCEIKNYDTDGNNDIPYLEQEDKAPGTGSSDISWSCPFWKRDPFHHMDCMSYKLRRIRDVKQHLMRKHYELPFYCPICQHKFSDIKERDHHIRQRTCTEDLKGRTDPPNTSIPPEKQELLRARLGGSDKEIWYQIWDILFEARTPPATPHQKTVIEEVVDVLQGFWSEHRLEIILDVTHGQDSYDEDADSIRAQLPGLMSTALSSLVRRVKEAVRKIDHCEPTSPATENYGTPVTSTPSSFTSTFSSKRHESFMKKKGQNDAHTRKLGRVCKEYMSMRKEIWQPLAARCEEKWNVVEMQCMSNGLKGIQSHARAYTKSVTPATSMMETSICQPPATPPPQSFDNPQFEGFENFSPSQEVDGGLVQPFGAGHDPGFDMGNDGTSDFLQDWDSSIIFSLFPGGHGARHWNFGASSASAHSEGMQYPPLSNTTTSEGSFLKWDGGDG